jgi:hypothetical protein
MRPTVGATPVAIVPVVRPVVPSWFVYVECEAARDGVREVDARQIPEVRAGERVDHRTPSSRVGGHNAGRDAGPGERARARVARDVEEREPDGRDCRADRRLELPDVLPGGLRSDQPVACGDRHRVTRSPRSSTTSRS